MAYLGNRPTAVPLTNADIVSVDASKLTGVVSVSQGGTSAGSAGAALTSLGAVAKVGDTLQGALNEKHGSDIASASTVNLDAATGGVVDITGSTTINAITLSDGAERTVRFAGALTLVNSTTLVLPGGANIAVSAGDYAVFRGYTGGIVRCSSYTKANGQAITPFTGGSLTTPLNYAPTVTLASSASVAIGAASANDITITGTTTITSFDTIAAGAHRTLTFSGTLTLTHNGTSLILPGATNITTAAGDIAEFVSLGSGNWRCEMYQRASGNLTSLINGSIGSLMENITVTAAAPSATQNFDALSQGVQYFTTNTANNFILNVRGNSTTSLNSMMGIGQSLTIAVMVTNGTTAYYPTSIQIDGTTTGVTTKWQGGTAPASGNASAVDMYAVTVVKTANATFSVFPAQTKFA